MEMVLSGSSIAKVSRNGMDPSDLVTFTVNVMQDSMKYVFKDVLLM